MNYVIMYESNKTLKFCLRVSSENLQKFLKQILEIRPPARLASEE